MEYIYPYVLVAYKRDRHDYRYRYEDPSDFNCEYLSKEKLIEKLVKYIDYDEVLIFREGLCVYEGYIRTCVLEDRNEFNEEKDLEWRKELGEIIEEVMKRKKEKK